MNRASRPRLSRISGSSYASQAMTRAGDGSTLSLDFTTGVLDPRLTFTRASTATYINSQGYVTTMAAAPTNDPTKARFDHDPTTRAPRGLLVEGQVSTINNYSESFDNAAWIAAQIDKTGMTSSQTDPAGGTNARILKADANAGRHAIYQVPGSNTNPGTGTLTVWAKSKELGFASLQLANAFESKSVTVTFDLATGATSGVVTSGMTHVASDAVQFRDGWWRLRLTATLTVGASPDDRMVPWIGLANASGSAGRSFTASGSGIYIWGAQLEAGSGASSYIPTGASTATRNRDELTLTNLSSIAFSQTSGTAFAHVEVREKATGAFTPYGSFDTSGGGRCWWWMRHNLDASLGTRLLGNAFNSAGATAITTSNYQYNSGNGGLVKFATSLDTAASAVVYVISGGSPQTTTASAFTLATAAQWSVNVNNDVGATTLGSMWMRSFKYWPTRLPNAQLQSLTT